MLHSAHPTNRMTWLVLLGLALATAGCDALSGTDDGGVGEGLIKKDSSPTPDVGAPPSGLCTFKKAGDTVELAFTAGTEQFLVIPYSVSSTSADAIDFSLTLGGGGGSSTTSHTLRQPRPKSPRDRRLEQALKDRLAVERWTRRQMEQAAASLDRHGPGAFKTFSAGCTLSSECKTTEICHAGACVTQATLKVADFSTSQTITAQVKKRGTLAAVLVDSADTVSDTAVSTLLDKFEKIIYPRDVALFGNPKLTSSGSVLSSDRNKDGLIWLVFTSKVKDKMSAVGFFNANDFDEQSTNSNKADILWVDSKTSSSLGKVYPILAHEFQHLLGYAVKKYRPAVNGGTGALEALWLDEGQSHFAEEACGFGGDNVTLLDQEVLPSFETLSTFSTTDSAGMRGMALLFVTYLFEQQGGVGYSQGGSLTDKGGAAFLAKLHGSTKQGVDAINAALGDYRNLFDTWISAMALDGRGVTSYSRYVYKPLVSDPVTGNMVGLKVRGSRVDSTGASVTLTGPLEEALTANTDDAIPNASGKLFLLKGKTGKVTVKVTSAATDFRFVVVKLK